MVLLEAGTVQRLADSMVGFCQPEADPAFIQGLANFSTGTDPRRNTTGRKPGPCAAISEKKLSRTLGASAIMSCSMAIRAVFYLAEIPGDVETMYCREAEKSMWFLPEIGMGIVQVRGLEMLREAVDAL
ncbi:MAG: hypothetical protein EOP85_11795 [Verrucomicrobiaceae bacterium]|nr:MAG: hypothetical protein EOP85_11795 [Verrucomicrobiaceae bacterium]